MSTSTGQWAEDVAANYLANKGYKVLEKNWKNRWCEIDIVAQRTKRIHFVEVKYRRSKDFGGGLDYITRRKGQQMQFAALQWVGEHSWQADYQLDVIAVEGQGNPKITYVPNAVGW
ncbi:YraN family protein [Candidatus Microgenomates bacterium]|nr:YraN family protein [Candidatus Microgenomates bacterium]